MSSNIELKSGGQQTNAPPNSFLNLIAWICAVGSMLLGYTTGIINGALPFLADDLALTPTSEGVVISALLVGAAFGSLAGGRFADRFGRKLTLIGCTILFLIGTLCTAFAPNVELLIVARAFLGVVIGGFSSPVGVMLAELSTPETRDSMVTRSFLMVMVGEFGAFLANAVLGIIWSENKSIWRWMSILSVPPALLELALIVWFMPESPRWLFSVGRPKEALAILKRIRANEADAEMELREIQKLGGNNAEEEEEGKGKVKIAESSGFRIFLSMLSECWFIRILLIGIGIGLCQASAAGGIIMYYGTLVLRDNNGNDTNSALLGNTANGLISLVASAIGLWVISRVPRRPMLLIGTFGAALPHSMIALSCWLLPNGVAKGWLILGGMLVFLSFQQGAIMTVSYLLLTEMFPLRVRGLAVGICLWFAWMNNFLTNMLFPLSLNALGYPITFGLIVCLCCAAGLFVLCFVPETRGKSLERLEMEFRGLTARIGDGKEEEKGMKMIGEERRF